MVAEVAGQSGPIWTLAEEGPQIVLVLSVEERSALSSALERPPFHSVRDQVIPLVPMPSNSEEDI